MPALIEIGHAVRGLWRLLHFDPSGLEYFDRSVAGFWRSFRVALLIAPLHALLIPYKLEMIRPTAGWQQIILVEILTYIVAWFLYPVVGYELCRWMDRKEEYPGYIAVYNWSTTMLVGAVVLAWLPTFAGITAAATSSVLGLLIYHLYYIYLWFLARAAVKIDSLSALGMIFVDYVLAFLLSRWHLAMLAPQ